MPPKYRSTVQVVPNELSVQIYRHEVPYFQPVPCWTYITDGLWAHKQKEDPNPRAIGGRTHVPHRPEVPVLGLIE